MLHVGTSGSYKPYSVPELSPHGAYLVLSQWAESDCHARLCEQKKYGAHLKRIYRSDAPWGWPLIPELKDDKRERAANGLLVGFVYFARDCTGALKVGVSITPEQRVYAIGGKARLQLVLRGCTRAHEKALHCLLQPDNTMGEWFQGELVESVLSVFLATAEKASAA